MAARRNAGGSSRVEPERLHFTEQWMGFAQDEKEGKFGQALKP